MPEVLLRELIYFWHFFSIQFSQIFYYWIAGMVLGSIISVFAKDKIHSMFTALGKRDLGLLGLVPASLIGIVSPLCMYGTIPIAASLAEKGIEKDGLPQSNEGELAAFMMSSILLNPQLLFYSAALGKALVVIRFTSCFLCGIFAGFLIRVFYRGKNFFNFGKFTTIENRDTDPNLFFRFLKNLLRNLKVTGPAFIAGVSLSALFQQFVPAEAMAALFGSHRGFGLLMAATVGVPLYVCGGGTIPLLASWINSGMSLGSASAFMITGPAMKITNLGAVKIILGIKHFVFYIGFSVIFALLTGLLLDLVMM